MRTDVPIIIPFKETSVRCPNKNFVLFPFVIAWLKACSIDIRTQVHVVTASDRVKEFVKEFGANVIAESKREHPSDILAAYDAAVSLHAESVVFLSLTTAFRTRSLVHDTVSKLKSSDVDFVASYQLITDRSLFYVDDNSTFINKSPNRKGCLCPQQKMVDGAIYVIKTDFLKKVSTVTDTNTAFWNGKFSTVLNDVNFFVDVDTPTDLEKFSMLSASFIQEEMS